MPVLMLGIVMGLLIIYAVGEAHAQAVCKQPPVGLISWWDAEGDAKDIVGSNNGSLENGATFAAGKVGQAFSFDGVNDFVKVPNGPSLNLQSQLSVEFWMKGDASNPMNACCQGLVTTDFYNIEGFDYERGINFGVSKNNGESFVAAGTLWGDAYPSGFGLIPGQWHHVVGTYDSAILKQFVDGRLTSALIFSGDISPMIIGGSSFLSFGSEDGRAYFPAATANRYFHGLIDEVSIYNRALASEEVSAIFAAGDKGKCKGVPFVNFSPSLAITLGPLTNDDSFDFSATATEGSGSDGPQDLITVDLIQRKISWGEANKKRTVLVNVTPRPALY